MQLAAEEAESAFTASGTELSEEALRDADLILEHADLANKYKLIPPGLRKVYDKDL
jgi:hypothetical protein